MSQSSAELALWAAMNDFFYSDANAIIGELEAGATIQELFLERKGRMSGLDLDAYVEGLKGPLNRGVELFTIGHPKYPERLRQTPNPPLVLYKRGKDLGFQNAVAVAGRRSLSSFGHKAARDIGRELASRGYLVVSGLARGADTGAHTGALEAGGETVAVLAGWLDDIYPKENTNLARDITQKGALLTMTSPLRHLQRHYFIRRNRITSGVSRLLIIVESSGKGGTMNQVEWALKQGRPVFILRPKGADQEAKKGYGQLIAKGAKGFADTHELVALIETVDFRASLGHGDRERRITDYSDDEAEEA